MREPTSGTSGRSRKRRGKTGSTMAVKKKALGTSDPGEHAWRKVASAFSEDEDQFVSSAVPRVLKELLEKIDRGEYEPGQKINTVELASSLQLSRAPIREALHILAGKGIVSLLPDRGAVLRPFSKERLIEALEVLNALTGHAFRGAALRMNDAECRAVIEGHQRAIAEAARESDDFHFWLAVHNFLYDVAELCGNSIIPEMISNLNLDLQARIFNEYIPLGRHRERYAGTFHRLTEALMFGEGRTAASIGASHAEWQIQQLRQAPEPR
jgi:DNA-binding GntR family transcriptional regulator